MTGIPRIALSVIVISLLSLCSISCGGDDPEPLSAETPVVTPPDGDDEELPGDDGGDDEGDDPVPAVPAAPAECDNKVVAHRGGAKELDGSVPDNSIAALDYAMSLRLYASECDIYVTSDSHVVVAHVDADGKINGYYPFEATLAELRSGGTLSNGETLPVLEDYLDHVMAEGSCTRLWLDIKNVTMPYTEPYYAISAFDEACRIIQEKKAEKWVEFICTGNETVMRACAPEARRYGIAIGWMANRAAWEYTSAGYEWANMSVSNMTDANHSGPRTVDEFAEAGVKLSVYNVDKPKNMRYYIERLDRMKAVCTNYPALLLQEMGVER